VRIDSVARFDFTGDGSEEAVVVASTCMTGTAGPDVHAVLTRAAGGELVELILPEVDRESYDVLFGNRNFVLRVADGLLVAIFTDSTGRSPLAIRYRWSGTGFVVDSISRSGRFRTSYDCARATQEVERVVCHVEHLAELDRVLARAYADLRRRLSARGELEEEQRRWLAERQARCSQAKRMVDCLADHYRGRIAELEQRPR
jgi:uncharacterized protein YecT (DUF1311 family)